jgi:hypothetical protein
MLVIRTVACAVLPLVALVLARPAACDTSDSSYSIRDLRASTAPPWNPPAPVPGAEAWESVLRFPGRIVSFPLVVAGDGAERGMIWAEQTAAIDKALLILARQRTLGLTVVPASLGDGTGIGGELSWVFPPLKPHLLAAVSGSTRQYNRERLGAMVGPLSAVYTSEWRPREPFFGLGFSTPHEGESAYAERSQSAILMLSWKSPSPTGSTASLGSPAAAAAKLLGSGSQIRAWAGPREALVSRGRDPDVPSFEIAHPAEAAGGFDRRIEHFTYGARLSHDTRRGIPHWSSGWSASVEAERRDKSIEGLALRDAHTGERSFTRMTYRAEAGASFGRDPRTLRLLVKAIDQRLDEGGGIFQVGDLMSLGGSNVAGYEPGRFQDLDLVAGRLTYIYPLIKNLEFDLHAEAGGVYPDLDRAQITSLKHSFGVSLRIRGDFSMLGQVGFDWSEEDLRLKFSFGGIE